MYPRLVLSAPKLTEGRKKSGKGQTILLKNIFTYCRNDKTAIMQIFFLLEGPEWERRTHRQDIPNLNHSSQPQSAR